MAGTRFRRAVQHGDADTDPPLHAYPLRIDCNVCVSAAHVCHARLGLSLTPIQGADSSISMFWYWTILVYINPITIHNKAPHIEHSISMF